MDQHVIFDTPKKPSFTQNTNKSTPQIPAFVWVNKNGGLFFSDKEIDTAYTFYHGGKFGKLTDTEVKKKFKGFPNPLNSSQIRKLRLRSDQIDVESIRNIIKNNRIQFNQFDPVREAFSFYDVERTGKISRDRIKSVLEKQGVGEITEEDIDDVFRICGADPSSQSDLTVENYRSIIEISDVESLLEASKKHFHPIPNHDLPRSASALNLTPSRIFEYDDSSSEEGPSEDENDTSQTKISRSASMPIKLDRELLPNIDTFNLSVSPPNDNNLQLPEVTIHSPSFPNSPKNPFSKTMSNIKLPHISSSAMNPKQELNPRHNIPTRTPSQMAPSRLMVSDPLSNSPSKRFSM